MSHSNPDSTLYCQVVDNKGSTGIAHIAHTFAPASRRCVLYRGVLSCKLPLYGYNEFPFILLKIKVVLTIARDGCAGSPPVCPCPASTAPPQGHLHAKQDLTRYIAIWAKFANSPVYSIS